MTPINTASASETFSIIAKEIAHRKVSQTRAKVTTFMVEVTTSRNTVFRWEIEDTTLANVLARITERVRGLDVTEVKIGEAN
jgi:hypothetical protein